MREDVNTHSDDQAIIEAGYQPQLKRNLGLFSSFAVSFSWMSITTCIFANYGFVLTKAGTFGFWTWPIVAFGLFLVALIFAEMAGRIPLTGFAYNWNSKLASPAIGWFTGWMALFVYAVGVAAVTTTMVPVFGVIVGRDFDPVITRLVPIGMVAIITLINIYGVRLASRTNIIAVCAELVGMIGLAAIIVTMTLIKGHPNFTLLTTIPKNPKPYLPGFLMASLLGAWTFIGFEGSADMSEETINARKIAPKGVIYSILVSATVGFIFIIAMTIAIPDLKSVTEATYPIAAIASFYIGDMLLKVFLVFVLVAMFACAMINMTGGSRLLFAMARDSYFPASPFFQKISAHHVPLGAIWLIAAVAIFFILIADNATSLYGAITVLAALVYLITVLSFAFNVQKLPKVQTFSLGYWHWPVIILAVVWLIIEIGILTIPDEFHSAAYASLGVIGVGIVVYFIAGRKPATPT